MKTLESLQQKQSLPLNLKIQLTKEGIRELNNLINNQELGNRILDFTTPNIESQKTGHWIKPGGMMPPEHHGHYECSECGAFSLRDWSRYKTVLSNYCPNCGAKMKNNGLEVNDGNTD